MIKSRVLIFIATSMLVASCAMVTSMIPEDKLPAPLKSALVALKAKQAKVEKQYTAATAVMIDAYGDLAECVGLKKQAAALKGEANALKASSAGADEARKAVKRTESLREEVAAALVRADSKTLLSREALTSGFNKRNQAYQLRAKLFVDASLNIADAISKFKSASNMEKAMLTTRLDPMYFMIRDYKQFKKAEDDFETNLAETRKRIPIPQLPRVAAPSAKLNMSF